MGPDSPNIMAVTAARAGSLNRRVVRCKLSCSRSTRQSLFPAPPYPLLPTTNQSRDVHNSGTTARPHGTPAKSSAGRPLSRHAGESACSHVDVGHLRAPTEQTLSE
eukprot:6180312-Pleurochrysis_carterae.AAC.1